MSLEDLYCDVDEFCRMFLPAWQGYVRDTCKMLSLQ